MAKTDAAAQRAQAEDADPTIDRDDEQQAAHDAELQRQLDVREAVEEAHKELPALGGPQLNPGNPDLGR